MLTPRRRCLCGCPLEEVAPQQLPLEPLAHRGPPGAHFLEPPCGRPGESLKSETGEIDPGVGRCSCASHLTQARRGGCRGTEVTGTRAPSTSPARPAASRGPTWAAWRLRAPSSPTPRPDKGPAPRHAPRVTAHPKHGHAWLRPMPPSAPDTARRARVLGPAQERSNAVTTASPCLATVSTWRLWGLAVGASGAHHVDAWGRARERGWCLFGGPHAHPRDAFAEGREVSGHAGGLKWHIVWVEERPVAHRLKASPRTTHGSSEGALRPRLRRRVRRPADHTPRSRRRHEAGEDLLSLPDTHGQHGPHLPQAGAQVSHGGAQERRTCAGGPQARLGRGAELGGVKHEDREQRRRPSCRGQQGRVIVRPEVGPSKPQDRDHARG